MAEVVRRREGKTIDVKTGKNQLSATAVLKATCPPDKQSRQKSPNRGSGARASRRSRNGK